MNENKICLKFDKLITDLAGNRYGVSVYESQVEHNVDFNKINIVIFPYEIEDIASSFIQGFYKKLGEEHGKMAALEIMELLALNNETQNKIKECIDTYGI
ncbi:MAG: hypothetical protein HFG32_09610 [Eubacterium sp.]|nr:hypothetical protein [Eubacterium sp.]